MDASGLDHEYSAGVWCIWILIIFADFEVLRKQQTWWLVLKRRKRLDSVERLKSVTHRKNWQLVLRTSGSVMSILRSICHLESSFLNCQQAWYLGTYRIYNICSHFSICLFCFPFVEMFETVCYGVSVVERSPPSSEWADVAIQLLSSIRKVARWWLYMLLTNTGCDWKAPVVSVDRYKRLANIGFKLLCTSADL